MRLLKAARVPEVAAVLDNLVLAERRLDIVHIVYQPSGDLGPDPTEAFEGVKAKAQGAENHGFVWFSVLDHLIQIGGVGRARRRKTVSGFPGRSNFHLGKEIIRDDPFGGPIRPELVS